MPIATRESRHFLTSASGSGTFWDRTDLVYSSEIFWSVNPSGWNATFTGNTAAMDIRCCRYQNVQVNVRTPASWQAELAAIAAMGMTPAPIGLPPIGNATNGPAGTYPCIDSSGVLTPGGYAWWQWTVQYSVPYSRLFEIANEPGSGALSSYEATGGDYFSNLWVNVPPLKAWARANGHGEIYCGGPAVNGGVGNWVTYTEAFLSACQARYVSTGNADWLPAFVSFHGYGGGGNAIVTLDQIGATADTLRTYLNASVHDGAKIKIVNSEYNYASQANAGTDYTSQSAMNTYYADFFAMSTAAAPDGQQRFWMCCEFCIENAGTNLFLLNGDGTTGIPGIAYKAGSAAAPVQPGTSWTPVP